MITLCFTYDVVTPESAEDGDVAERGFYESGGWQYQVPGTGDVYEKPVWKPGKLRCFIKTARDLGCAGDCGRWFESGGEDTDYRTGETTSYAAHIEGCTRSTYARIARLLRGKR